MKQFIVYSGNLNDYPFKQNVKTEDDVLYFRKTGFIYEGLHTLRHFWMVMSRDRDNKRHSKRHRTSSRI